MKNKNFDLVLFSSLFTGLYVISNVVAIKQVEIFGLLVTSSFVVYPLTFVISNIVNERLGIKEARKIVTTGLITMLILLGLVCIIHYLPVVDGKANDAFQLVFINNIWIYFASFISFVISQIINITIYNGMKSNITIKYIFSASIAVFIDAILFKSMITYFGVVDGEIFVEVISHVLFGVLTILVATPFFYLFCYNSKKKAN